MDADKHNDGEEDQYGRRDCLEDQTPPAVVVKSSWAKPVNGVLATRMIAMTSEILAATILKSTESWMSVKIRLMSFFFMVGNLLR
ncbi:hypothetical protein [uncultured Limosilactobacillus sp.]|uniref:hypothetical protein n=1 Tax=uncultured Limosilactobacillus sp. TaxID=2837629 RepID=UPI002596501C|nr:hypothetical protein [uncultured Limosilactobacillus sp.]